MMNVPSFLVGSLTSGSAFLLVHQQLSHRESMSRKWAMAERAENELKAQLKNLKIHLKDQTSVVGAYDASFATKNVSNYYKQMLDDAQNFFGKKD